MNLNPADEEVALALLLADEDELAKATSLDRERPVVAHARAAIETTLRTFLTHLALRLAIGARGIAKAEEGKDDPVIGAAESTDWTTVQDAVRPQLQMVARDAARLGLHQVGGGMDRLLTQADPRAITWANERAAELVTEIGDTTRQGVRDLVARALEEGWSNETLAAELLAAPEFAGARAELIARTETAMADVAGNVIGWQASGVVAEKEWKVADANECDLCAEMDGEKVPVDEEFPDGDPPLHPNCVLADTLVSAAGVSAHFKRWFEGEVICLRVEGYDDLTITPNHPVLTARGWVAARDLGESDYLVQASNPGVAVAAVDPENHHVQARVEEIAGALRMAGGVTTRRVPVAPEHFHGDGIVGEDVDVVLTDRALKLANQSAAGEQFGYPLLFGARMAAQPLLGRRDLLAMSERLPLSTDGRMRSGGDADALRRLCPRHAELHALTRVADDQPSPLERVAKRRAMTAELPRELDARLAEHVALVKVAKLLHRKQWKGHVYNLQTDGGWYIASGLIVHNCRCDLLPVLADEAE